jgi:hypothetical protein
MVNAHILHGVIVATLVILLIYVVYMIYIIKSFGDMVCRGECQTGLDSYFIHFTMTANGMSYSCGNCVGAPSRNSTPVRSLP